MEAFRSLRQYFARDAELAQALGWDEGTVAEWRDQQVVRPQLSKVRFVLLVDELAQEARAYLLDDRQVGAWLNAPLPNLRGSSPARWLQLRGAAGLRELTRGLVDWTPRRPELDLEPISISSPPKPRKPTL